jgi:hypothetical protein
MKRQRFWLKVVIYVMIVTMLLSTVVLSMQSFM